MIRTKMVDKVSSMNKGFALFSSLVCLSIGQVGYSQSWTTFQKKTDEVRAMAANFGHAIAISDSWAVVGVPRSAGNPANVPALDQAGAVNIYKINNGVWTFETTLYPSDNANYAGFGYDVAISGSTIVVTANADNLDAAGANSISAAGSAYIYELTGGQWTFMQKIVASDRAANDAFGQSVAIDGTRIVVGAPNEDHDANGAAQLQNSGSIYVFDKNGATWSQTAKLTASDRYTDVRLGNDVALKGDVIAAGAALDGYLLNAASLVQGAGSVYTYQLNGATWSQTAKLTASDRSFDANFGRSVSLATGKLAVGAFKEAADVAGANNLTAAGAVYVFDASGSTWTQSQKIVSGNRQQQGQFGNVVAITGTRLLIGASNENLGTTNTVEAAGAAYYYELENGTWSLKQTLTATDAGDYDSFGTAVALTGLNLVVGASKDGSDANNSNELMQAGSIYTAKKICTFDMSVSLSGSVLTAGLSGATYQWINCDNNTPIAGATSQSYTATETGNYAVEINSEGCINTSACQLVEFLSIGSANLNKFSVAPNPSNGKFTVSSTGGFTNQSAVVYSLIGNEIMRMDNVTGSQLTIDLSNEQAGVYLLKLSNDTMIRLIKK